MGRPEALVLLTRSGKEKGKGEETFFFFPPSNWEWSERKQGGPDGKPPFTLSACNNPDTGLGIYFIHSLILHWFKYMNL